MSSSHQHGSTCLTTPCHEDYHCPPPPPPLSMLHNIYFYIYFTIFTVNLMPYSLLVYLHQLVITAMEKALLLQCSMFACKKTERELYLGIAAPQLLSDMYWLETLGICVYHALNTQCQVQIEQHYSWRGISECRNFCFTLDQL